MSKTVATYRNDHYDVDTAVYQINIEEYIGYWKSDPSVIEWYINSYPKLKKVILVMTSKGGDPIPAIEVGNKFQRLKEQKGIEVEGDIRGFAASAAITLLLASCDRIRMLDRSMVLIHPLQGYLEWVTIEQGEQSIENMRRIEQLFVDIYMNRVAKKGKSEEQLRALMKQEKWLTPEEALEWGLIDAIYSDPTVTNTHLENSVAYQNYIQKGGTPVPTTKLKNSKNIPMETKVEQQQPQTTEQKPTVKQKELNSFLKNFVSLFVVQKDEPKETPPATPEVQNASTETPPVTAKEVPAVPVADDEMTKLRNEMTQISEKFANAQEQIKKLESLPAGRTLGAVKVETMPSIQVGNNVYDLKMRQKQAFKNTYNAETGKYQLSKERVFLNSLELGYLRDHKPHLFKEQTQLMLANNCCPDFSQDPLSGVDLTALEDELGNITAHVPALSQFMIDAFNVGRAPNIPVISGGILNHKYYSVIGAVGEVIQPINGCNYNSKGDMDFEPFGNIQRGWKIDKDVCPTNYYQGYFSYLNSNNFSPWEHPFVTYFLQKLLEAGVRDDLNLAQWFGEFDNASTNANSVYDGYWTIINDHTTAANIITMPAFNPAVDSALDYINDFVAALPTHWRFGMMPVSINIPTHIAAPYKLEYREAYNSECCFLDNGGQILNELQIWQHANMRAVPTLGMGIGDRLIASLDGVLYYRRGNSINNAGNPMVQQCKRSLATMIDVIGTSMISTVNPAYLLVSDQVEQQHPEATFNPTGLNVTFPSFP